MNDAVAALIKRHPVILAGSATIPLHQAGSASWPEDAVILAVDGYAAGHWIREGPTVLTAADLLDDAELGVWRTAAETAVDWLLVALTGVDDPWATVSEPRQVPLIDRRILIDWLNAHLVLCGSLELLAAHVVSWQSEVVRAPFDPARHESVSTGTLLAELTPMLIEGRTSARSSQGRTFRASLAEWAHGLNDSWIQARARRTGAVTQMPRDRVVVPILSLEWYRHAEDLAELAECGLSPVLVPLDVSYRARYAKAQKVMSRTGHLTLMRSAVRRGTFARHLRSLRTSLDAWHATLASDSTGASERAARVLADASPFLARRWAAMAADWESWRDLWDRRAPAAVIVVRSTTSSLLPLHAAAAAGVGAVSLPHGMAEEDLSLPHSPGVFHLTPFPLGPMAADSGWVSSASALLEREYVRANAAPPAGIGGTSPAVLVLVDQSGVRLSGAYRTVGLMRDFLAFADRCRGVEFLIKDHPSVPILGPLCDREVPSNVRVASRDADLHGVIRACAGVVLLDYEGSAALHAIRSGRPVIRFEPDERTRARTLSMAPEWREVLGLVPRVGTYDGLAGFLESLAGSRVPRSDVTPTEDPVVEGGPTVSEIVRLATDFTRRARPSSPAA